MSKVLTKLSAYVARSSRYDNLSKDSLEHMREHGEKKIREAHGREQVIGAFEQSISAKLLNQKFGTNYATADFTENGQITMVSGRSSSGVSRHREIPDIVKTSEEPENISDFTF